MLILFLLLWWQRDSKNVPPGPWGLPVVGVLPFLGRDPQLTMMQWAKRYGNVFSVRMGTKTAVILMNGYEAIREVFQKKGADCSGRARMPTFGYLGGRGILWSDASQTQRTQKEFAMKYLSKADIEFHTQKEIDALVQHIKDKNGEPFDFSCLISALASNIIGAILFGKRQDYDDPDFIGLIDSYHNALDLSAQASIENCFPFLGFLPQCKRGRNAWRTFANNFNWMMAHNRTGYRANATRGLADAFLHKSNLRGPDCQLLFSEDDTATNCRSLYFAGSETTSLTMTWGMLFLLSNRDAISKIQAEIDEMVGQERRPALADRPKLPFTCATLMEIQRCNYISPFSLPHKATNDVTANGHLIPKGTTILANHWSIFMNNELWGNPHAFQPERFLDECGRLKKIEQFIPFSVGPRSCPGEVLARQELFLVFTALLQGFSFRVPDGEALPDLHYPAPGMMIYLVTGKLPSNSESQGGSDDSM
ncbi:cytochrome P450 2D17-like [Lingula anatina]|uniref:Cytochrome P450 2D17-like n=1 Tax=Lingula anatina TaxID=7574 RepID=A0A1S3JPS4_LINAN|nr:cytochrome P450 2D17-like [Lingula anatina]|eukprot:XP_013412375.1 cytochrome P450 2D17-like [Lingula anatina]